MDLVSRRIRKLAKKELKAIPLSKNTICRKIDKTLDDINDQLEVKMRGDEFGLQLNGAATSTSNKDAYLICDVRFIDNNDNIVKDLLFYKPILTS